MCLEHGDTVEADDATLLTMYGLSMGVCFGHKGSHCHAPSKMSSKIYSFPSMYITPKLLWFIYKIYKSVFLGENILIDYIYVLHIYTLVNIL